MADTNLCFEDVFDGLETELRVSSSVGFSQCIMGRKRVLKTSSHADCVQTPASAVQTIAQTCINGSKPTRVYL